MDINIKFSEKENIYKMPTRDEHDAGWDCYATENTIVYGYQTIKMPLGFAMQLPENWAALLLPRSGLASKGLTLANTPGLIDESYRGEIQAALINYSNSGIKVNRGERVCQMIFVPVPQVVWQQVDILSASNRGEGSFGSTGR